jgi:hypothetical protein
MRPLAFVLGGLTFLMLLACGGGGVGGPGLPPEDEIAVIGGEGFNGSDAPLRSNASATTVDGRLIVNFGSSVRMLRVSLPTPTVTDGQTFAIGGEGGATVRFFEAQDRNPVTHTWIGTQGSVTVRVNPRTQLATLELHAAQFQADATVEGNLANGSFSIDGNLLGISFAGGGNVGGEATLAFTAVNNVNAITTSIDTSNVLYAYVESHALLATSSNERLLSVNLLPSAQAGDEIALTGASNPKASVVFAAGNGNPAKIWLAKGGTLRILTRSATQARVELINATFQNPTPQTGNAARGTFTLNGVIEAD